MRATAIQVAFFDIDNTLLAANLPPSAATKKQIARIQHLGVQTAVASGRPLFAAQEIIQALNLVAAGSFFNGALIYEPLTETVLHESPLDTAIIDEVIAYCHSHALYLELYCIDGYHVAQDHPYRAVHKMYLQHEANISNLAATANETAVYKLLTVIDENDPKAMSNLAQLKSQFPQLRFAAGHGSDHPHLHFVSITDMSADKEKVFEQLLCFYDVDAQQVFAIGDSESDRTFIDSAGVGVAMGNASNFVKDVADYHTKTVGEDGVAHALQVLIREI